MAKADEEDIPWEFKPTNLDEKLRQLDELEREKQDDHALDVNDLQQLYGQAVSAFNILSPKIFFKTILTKILFSNIIFFEKLNLYTLIHYY